MGNSYYGIQLMCKAILRKVESIDDKISALAQQVKAPSPLQIVYFPVSIQKTRDALKTFNEPVAASEVAAITRRARAVESMHLNELFRMGLVEKKMNGHRTVFVLKEETL